MTPRQANQSIQRVGRHCSVPEGEQARPQPSPRKSLRLQYRQEHPVSKDTNTEPKHQLPSAITNTPSTEVPWARGEERKRKRPQEPEGPSNLAPFEPLGEQRPTSRTNAPTEYTYDQRAVRSIDNNKANSIAYWSEEGHWPKQYFTPDHQTRKDFENYNGIPWVAEMEFDHPYATKNLSSSFRSRLLEAGSITSATASDEKPRDVKSIFYNHASYGIVLASKGSFMKKFDLGITDASKELCRTLLEAEQSVPQDTLFRDDLFEETCEAMLDQNEAMVIRDISPLICPSARRLRIYGGVHLKAISESVNKGWNRAEPFWGPRPQPDYSVGFGRSAFMDIQLEKLEPFVGDATDTGTSCFMATWLIYFPFLTCEVKCSATALDVADRQNAHSMTVAVRGVVDLFRIVKRQKEIDREILAFSVSHDNRNVRIYGHYPVLDGEKTTFYRHMIYSSDFTALDGKEKWTAYKFTKNVYDMWMPTHLKRICSAIDDLPLGIEAYLQPAAGESGL